MFNSFKIENNPNYIERFSPYHAVNTLRLGHKNHVFNDVFKNKRCLS